MGILSMLVKIFLGASSDDEPTANGRIVIYGPGRPSLQVPPSLPGEYRWINSFDNTIEYIGETVDLRRRRNEHARSEAPWSLESHRFAWKVANDLLNSQLRRQHEKEKIAQHKPIGNKRAGGGGRHAKM